MANKKIPITKPHVGITGVPFRMAVRDPETGEGVVHPEDVNKDADDQRLVTRVADTCDLFDHIWMRMPKWGLWPGANDNAHIDRIALAVADAREKYISTNDDGDPVIADGAEIVLTEGDYNWLHGSGESEKGKGDGRVGYFDRREPKGKDFDKDDPDADARRESVGSFVFGGNEARYRRALEVPKSKAEEKAAAEAAD